MFLQKPECEILENGVDVAEMQALQLQKLEELTLYTIEQENRIKDLEALVMQLLEAKK